MSSPTTSALEAASVLHHLRGVDIVSPRSPTTLVNAEEELDWVASGGDCAERVFVAALGRAVVDDLVPLHLEDVGGVEVTQNKSVKSIPVTLQERTHLHVGAVLPVEREAHPPLDVVSVHDEEASVLNLPQRPERQRDVDGDVRLVRQHHLHNLIDQTVIVVLGLHLEIPLHLHTSVVSHDTREGDGLKMLRQEQQRLGENSRCFENLLDDSLLVRDFEFLVDDSAHEITESEDFDVRDVVSTLQVTLRNPHRRLDGVECATTCDVRVVGGDSTSLLDVRNLADVPVSQKENCRLGLDIPIHHYWLGGRETSETRNALANDIHENIGTGSIPHRHLVELTQSLYLVFEAEDVRVLRYLLLVSQLFLAFIFLLTEDSLLSLQA